MSPNSNSGTKSVPHAAGTGNCPESSPSTPPPSSSPSLSPMMRRELFSLEAKGSTVIPIPHNLSFTSSTDDFEAWWAMWKTHAFRRALGPLLKQLDAEYDIPAEQQQDGPEPVHDDGSSFTLHPPAPVVLFCKNSPSLKKVVMQNQPILPKSAPKSGHLPGSCPPALARTAKSPARIHSPTKRTQVQAPPGEHHAEPAGLATVGFKETAPEPAASQLPSKQDRVVYVQRADASRGLTNDTSSGEVKEVVMPSTTLDLATSKSGVDKATTLATPSAETQEPIASSSAAPMVLGEGYDLSNLLTFDPEFIEPSAKASEESRVTLARQRIGLRHAQLPLKADIADKCQRLNEKKAALDAKTDTSASTAELEILRKELEDLEERVRVTKQLIQDKEALIARSHEEAEGLKAELKTDLAEIRALNKQLVTGQDEDDEAEIAEVDHVRAALCALEAFLQ
ncbi:hypothetical protein QYE76_003686 [Lolium multiflorum]|uniref:Uncharacterized protein n=1 Tax=Lolium multiflorum TaxID=4521 RepID=A0AAD8W1T7_LOLMU|nr:hypothetical protein QYE76_003686 [Lolium multiflorum]